MLELINKSSQTVVANDTIALGSTSIVDNANRMYLINGDTVEINTIGKYKIVGTFVVSNTTSSAVNVTVELFANSSAFGLPITVTVPATTGYSEIVIEKTINVKASTYGNIASIQFLTPTGATITGCQVDVFKRV